MSDINYGIAPINPMPGMIQALQFGSAVGGMQAQKQQALAQAEAAKIAAQKKAEHDAKIAAAYELIRTNPSGESYAALANLQPADMAESTRKNFTMLDEATQQATLNESAKVFAAFKSGNTDLALKLLQEKADAYRNAGNQKGLADTQGLYAMASEGAQGAQGVEDFFGLMIAQMPKGKDAIEAIVKFSEEQRAANLAETLAKNPGQLKPKEISDLELALNKEYTTRTKGYSDALRLDSVIKASAADASGAGDLALVTTFMKMLDPGSVVRESEFAAAQDTSGLLGKLMSSATKIQNGQILTPQQRADFGRLAGQYMTASAEQEKKSRKDLEFMVKNYGLNKENVFGTMADGTAGTATKPAATGAPAVVYPNTFEGAMAFARDRWKANPDYLKDLDGIKTMQGLQEKFGKTYTAFQELQGTASQPIVTGGK